MTTAQVDWVAIYNAPAITWEFRERPEPGGGGSIAREMVTAGTVSQADVDTFASQNHIFRDRAIGGLPSHAKVSRHNGACGLAAPSSHSGGR